jgi:flagellar biosynthesis protein FlhB
MAVAITWLGGIALLTSFGAVLWRAIGDYGQRLWSRVDLSVNAAEAVQRDVAGLQSIFWTTLLPILAGVAVIAVLAWSAQSGFRIFPHLAAPDPTRLDPVRNLSRSLQGDHLASVASGLLKFAALAGMAVWVVLGDLDTLRHLGSRGPLAAESREMATWLLSAAQRLCMAAVVVGLTDYGIHWFWHRRSLQMTDQEVREEQRATEPPPEVAAWRRIRSSG